MLAPTFVSASKVGLGANKRRSPCLTIANILRTHPHLNSHPGTILECSGISGIPCWSDTALPQYQDRRLLARALVIGCPSSRLLVVVWDGCFRH